MKRELGFPSTDVNKCFIQNQMELYLFDSPLDYMLLLEQCCMVPSTD